MPLDPALLEPILTTIAGGGLGATVFGLLRVRPERKKLEAESARIEAQREATVTQTSANAMELVTDAISQIREAQNEIIGLRAELREARQQVAELMTINARLEAEVRNLRGRLVQLEGEHGD